MWLPLTSPLLGIWSATQACALTGNRTDDLVVCRTTPSPLSHTNQGCPCFRIGQTSCDLNISRGSASSAEKQHSAVQSPAQGGSVSYWTYAGCLAIYCFSLFSSFPLSPPQFPASNRSAFPFKWLFYSFKSTLS